MLNNVFLKIIVALSFLFCLFVTLPSYSQVIVAGTDFNATTDKTNEYYVAADNIQHYGATVGTLLPKVPINNGLLSAFTSQLQYVIINNPVKIDSSKFKDVGTPDYMMVISPSGSGNTSLLTYQVTDMAPGSNATVSIKACHVVDPLKTGNTNTTYSCVGQPTGVKIRGQNNNNFDWDIQLDAAKQGTCSTATKQIVVDVNGEINLDFTSLQTGKCSVLGISNIEINGKINPIPVSVQGEEVCAGEQIILRPKVPFKGSFAWEGNDGNGWKSIGNTEAVTYETKLEGTYQFRYSFTPAGGSAIPSSTISLKAIKCCEGPGGSASSRATIYYDDFGTTTSADGKNYKVWDYKTDPENPVQVSKTTNYPFRWPLSEEPAGFAKFNNGVTSTGNCDNNSDCNAPHDGDYVIASNIGYTTGSKMAWAGNVTGKTNSPQIAYDHSGTLNGAAFFLNNPYNSQNSIVYKREITNLCIENGRTIFFECYIAVFTSSVNGVKIDVRLTGGAAPVILKGEACPEAGTCQVKGQWVRIAGSVELTGNTLTMEVINNAPNDWNKFGNDLVIDDIKILACAPPPIDLVFNATTLVKAIKACKDVDLIALPTSNFNTYFGGTPNYIYQWSITPDDVKSWKTIDGVETATKKTIADLKAKIKPDLVNGNKVYFRVVASKTASELTKAGAVFNLLDPCRKFSASQPIEVTIDCPACVTPTSLKVENGATTIADKGSVTVCEGSPVSLNLTGAWALPPAALTDKNFEFYVINKTTSTELWKSTPAINGGTGGNAKYNIAGSAVTSSLSGDYIIGIRNAACKLEQVITIKVNSKIKNNAITADQTICLGGTVTALTQDVSKTLSGDLDVPAYQWQSSTTNATTGFSNVSGTAAAFTPAGLTQTTYFRRIAKAKGGFCADSTSKAVTIKVDQPITSAQNTIATTTPIICSGNAPSVTGLAITNATYVWEQGTTASGPWTPLASGTTQDLPSNPLTNTASGTTKSFFFHRIATLGKCSHTSSEIEVKVSGGMTAGEISKDTSVCKDGTSIPPKFTSISPATGGTTPPILYEWEVSDDGTTNWTSLGAKSAANLEYTPSTVPTKDQYYRRKAYAGTGLCDNATSKTVKVLLVNPPVAVIISPVKVTSLKSESWTFNDLVLNVSATPVPTGFVGTWAINSKGKLDLPLGSATNSVSGMNFDDKSVLTWTVKDSKGRCTADVATLNIERKNITVANAQDDSLCENSLPYKLVGNGLITGEVSKWSFVSSSSSVPVSWTLRNDSTQIAVLNSVNIPVNAGKVELIFRYAVKSPLLPDSSFKTVKIIVYEKSQLATVLNSPINTCASQVKIEGNRPLQSSATGTWKIVNGQGTVENINLYSTNLKDLNNVETTNLTWTITNHLCTAPSAPLVVNQKGKSTDAKFSISGGAYTSKEITNALDVPLCKGVAYTLNTILPSTGLKGTETGTWSSTSTATITGNGNSVPLAPMNEGIADAQWAIDPHITGCDPSTATATFKIGDVPQLDPISGKSSLCEGDTAHYKATLTTGANINVLGADSYDWNVLHNIPSPTGRDTILGPDNVQWVDMKFSSASTSLDKDQATITLTATNACGTTAVPLTKLVNINLTPRVFNGDIKGDSLLCQSITGIKNYTIQNQVNTTETIWTLGALPVSTGSANAVTADINATDITSKFPAVKLKIQLKNSCGLGVFKEKQIDIIEAVPVKALLIGKEKVCLPLDVLVYTGSTPNGGSGATFAFQILHKDGTTGNSQAASLVNTFPVNMGELADGDKIVLNVTGDPVSGCFSGNGLPASINIDGYNYPDTTVFKAKKFQPDSICTGDAIELCVPQTKGNASYQWFKDEIKTSQTNNCIKLTNSWQSGKYRVKIDNKVCPADSSYNKQVKIYDTPSVQILPEDITIELAVTPVINLIGAVANLPVDPLTQIEWGPNDYLSTTTNPLVVAITPPVMGGDFYYVLKVATGEGRAYCPATALAHVKALPPVNVPNAFTPNGDGLNDKWHIEGIDTYSNAKVYIYNRWGTQIFKASPYGKGNEWDGTTNGGELPTGTYYYVIELHEDTQFQKPKMSGAVTIIR